eukprot:539996_1
MMKVFACYFTWFIAFAWCALGLDFPGGIRQHWTEECLEDMLERDQGLPQRMEEIEAHWQANPNCKVHSHGHESHRRLQALPSPLNIPIDFLIVQSPNRPYIGYEQLISQIRVLNEDFLALNDDLGQNGDGSVSGFADVAGSFDITFSLNKIVRKDTRRSQFSGYTSMKQEATGGISNLGENSNHTLSFWIVNVPDLLGFATFPGFERQWDGIVLSDAAIGSKDYDRDSTWILYNNYDLGRTATHEIGHWLNLRHIWGDGDCQADDFVSDTPVDDGPNYGCPQTTIQSCGSDDMYMNYMDYVYDACMNMFTDNQVDRGDDLFLSGGFREELTQYAQDEYQTSDEFVDYFYFVYGANDDCDPSHVRVSIDTKDAAIDTDDVSLCVSKSSSQFVDVITDIQVVSGTTVDVACPSGYEKVDSDLGLAPDGTFIFVCFKKESSSTASNVVTVLTVISLDVNANLPSYYEYYGELGVDSSGKKVYLVEPITSCAEAGAGFTIGHLCSCQPQCNGEFCRSIDKVEMSLGETVGGYCGEGTCCCSCGDCVGFQHYLS